MKKNVKTVLPFGLLIASLFFFFNPNIQLVDLLPDLFGYVLLVTGLRFLADMNESINEARVRFQKMFYVEIAKFIALLLAFGGLVSPQEQSTYILLATLCFCVIELLILIPATRALFAGGMQLAIKFGSEAIFKTYQRPLPKEPSRGGRNAKQRRAFEKRVGRIRYRNGLRRCALEKLQTLTLIFVAIKPLMALIPEFSALSGTEYNEGLVDFYDFITLFRGFGVLLLLPFSVYWVVRVIRFLRSLRRDTAFVDACQTYYRTDILPKTELFIQRAVKAGLSLLGLGMVFSVDFYVDYYNIMPDILCAALVICGVLVLRRYLTAWRPVVFCAAAYGVMTLVSSGLTVWFNTAYYFNAIYKDAEAAAVYYSAGAATVLENLLFLAMLWFLTRLMWEMIVRYSGFSVTSAADPSSSERVRRVHLHLQKTMHIFLGGALVCAMTGVMYEFLKPTVPYMWMIDFAVSIVYVYLFYRSTWEISEQVEYKFMLS
ncbi:MAG: hypothetical protein IJW99_03115 [Clostridia bacterium]|nr:hypothetical protein [Clostridia bacterium]